MGGWVINAEGLRFCHAGDGDCFDRYHQDNLRKIMAAMKKQYGAKAKEVFYASENKGTITGVKKKKKTIL